MEEAGRYSSSRFLAEHPQAYSMMRYSKLDVRFRGFLYRLIAAWLDPVLRAFRTIGDAILERPIMPFAWACLFVKALAGLSYMVGTSKASSDCNADS